MLHKYFEYQKQKLWITTIDKTEYPILKTKQISITIVISGNCALWVFFGLNQLAFFKWDKIECILDSVFCILTFGNLMYFYWAIGHWREAPDNSFIGSLLDL